MPEPAAFASALAWRRALIALQTRGSARLQPRSTVRAVRGLRLIRRRYSPQIENRLAARAARLGMATVVFLQGSVRTQAGSTDFPEIAHEPHQRDQTNDQCSVTYKGAGLVTAVRPGREPRGAGCRSCVGRPGS